MTTFDVNAYMDAELEARGVTYTGLSPAARVALNASADVVETYTPTIQDDPHALRVLAALYRAAAFVAEDRATAMERGAISPPAEPVPSDSRPED